MKRLLMFFLLFALMVPMVRADMGGTLQTMLDDRVAKWKVPGGVLRVEVPGMGVWTVSSGVGDLESNTPINPTHLFRIASNSKSFTAAAILRLQERGLLKVSDTIDHYLADLKIPSADSITILHLLNHTSGLGDYLLAFGQDVTPLSEFTPEQLIAVGLALEPDLHFRPGTGWKYSNSGYIALGIIIERTSGKTYEQFITDEFITPLGLKHTYVPVDAGFPETYTKGYTRMGDGSFTESSLFHPSLSWSAGNIISTVDDLAAWITALAGGKVLNQESQTILQDTVPVGVENFSYGGGLMRYGNSIWWHNGSIPEYLSQMWMDTATGAVVTAYVNNENNPGIDFELFCLEVFNLLSTTTGVAEKTTPAPFTLGANYPNPFNPVTQFTINLPESSPITVEVFNLQGQVIRRLSSGRLFSPGIHTMTWDSRDADGRPVSSGVYIYRASTAKMTIARKMNLIR